MGRAGSRSYSRSYTLHGVSRGGEGVLGTGKQHTGFRNSPRQNVVREGNICYLGRLLDIGLVVFLCVPVPCADRSIARNRQ